MSSGQGFEKEGPWLLCMAVKDCTALFTGGQGITLVFYLPSPAIQPATGCTSVVQEGGMWPAKEFVILLGEM